MIAGLFLVDTSAAAAALGDPDLTMRLQDLANAGLLATCLPLDLEAGYSAVSPSNHYMMAAQRRELLIELPTTPEIAIRAREIQAALAAKSQHRAAGAFNVMIAAFALVYAATILHRDPDYDIIASVTDLMAQRVP